MTIASIALSDFRNPAGSAKGEVAAGKVACPARIGRLSSGDATTEKTHKMPKKAA
jgi:hypothetical protein